MDLRYILSQLIYYKIKKQRNRRGQGNFEPCPLYSVCTYRYFDEADEEENLSTIFYKTFNFDYKYVIFAF